MIRTQYANIDYHVLYFTIGHPSKFIHVGIQKSIAVRWKFEVG